LAVAVGHLERHVSDVAITATGDILDRHVVGLDGSGDEPSMSEGITDDTDRAPYSTLTGRSISAPSAGPGGTFHLSPNVDRVPRCPAERVGSEVSSSGYSSASMNTVSPMRSSASDDRRA
jgi:hypothetical protein